MAANFATATAQSMVVPVEGAIIQGSTRSEELETPTVVNASGITAVVGAKKYTRIQGSVSVKGDAGLSLAVAATGSDGQLLVTQVEQSEDVGEFPSGTINLSGYANL
jgi:hypothetical protein